MKKANKRTVGAAVILVLACGWFLFKPKPNDEVQIKTALLNAVKASKEGRPGGVVEYLANDVVVNGQHYDVNGQFTNFIRQYHPDIQLGPLHTKIDDDTASVTSDIQFTVLTRTMDIPSVTFTLQKEKGTKWLLFPSQDWKLTGASASPEAYAQIVQELAGSSGLGM